MSCVFDRSLPEALPAIARDVATVLATPTPLPRPLVPRATRSPRVLPRMKNPLVVGLTMLRTSCCGSAAPARIAGVAINLTGRMSPFVAAHYRRGNAFATPTGRVDDAVNAAARAVRGALREGASRCRRSPCAPDAAGARIVTHRDIGWRSLVGFAAPALGERDFAAMLVVRALLGGVSPRAATTTVGPFERGIAPIYDYDVKPATFSIALNGGRIDPSAALDRMRALLRATAERPLTATQLAGLREGARGAWMLEAITLSDRAWQIGAAVATGAAPGAAADAGAAIAQVTADDVQRVARTYLQRSTVALILPRNAAP